MDIENRVDMKNETKPRANIGVWFHLWCSTRRSVDTNSSDSYSVSKKSNDIILMPLPLDTNFLASGVLGKGGGLCPTFLLFNLLYNNLVYTLDMGVYIYKNICAEQFSCGFNI